MKKQMPKGKFIGNYVDASTKHFIIGGEHYILGKTTYKKIDGIRHQDKILFKKVDTGREEKILDEIANKLKEGITVEKIIKEAIKKQLGLDEREELIKLLRNGKAKIKEQNGCYGFVVKGRHFQLFD